MRIFVVFVFLWLLACCKLEHSSPCTISSPRTDWDVRVSLPKERLWEQCTPVPEAVPRSSFMNNGTALMYQEDNVQWITVNIWITAQALGIYHYQPMVCWEKVLHLSHHAISYYYSLVLHQEEVTVHARLIPQTIKCYNHMSLLLHIGIRLA